MVLSLSPAVRIPGGHRTSITLTRRRDRGDSMSQNSSLGVAVIGAGMAGRAHIAGYRSASTVYATNLPEVRLVAVGDLNPDFATAAARRFGYERAETDWKRIADAPDIDVVSVVVANFLHREVVEGLL